MLNTYTNLNEFISVYDNALDPGICDTLISFFENNVDAQERCDYDGRPNFQQLNLSNLSSKINDIHNQVINQLFEYGEKYHQFIGNDVFPEEFLIENVRIKRYNPGGIDRFDTHVDVRDHVSCRRFLAFLWYLNDVEIGGDTVFKDLVIKPQKGKLIVFPPLWLFPHRGESPISGTKYIMSSYLLY